MINQENWYFCSYLLRASRHLKMVTSDFISQWCAQPLLWWRSIWEREREPGHPAIDKRTNKHIVYVVTWLLWSRIPLEYICNRTATVCIRSYEIPIHIYDPHCLCNSLPPVVRKQYLMRSSMFAYLLSVFSNLDLGCINDGTKFFAVKWSLNRFGSCFVALNVWSCKIRKRMDG